MSDESSVALRTLIRATADTPASGDDIANIVSNPLPDGAACFVIAERAVFRFRKFSALPTVAGDVIAPNAGGGRWVREGTVAGALAAFAAANDLNTAPTNLSANWTPSGTANYTLLAGLGSWVFTAGGCFLRYTGVPSRYLCHVSATITIVPGQTVQIGISLDDDLTGTAAGDLEGINFIELPTGEAGTQTVAISAQRYVELVPLSTIQPKYRYSGGTVIDLERVTISAIPVP